MPLLLDQRVWGNERSKELRENCHIGEFAEKETVSMYVHRLRDLYGSEHHRTLDQGKRNLWLGRKSELACQVCYAHTLSCTVSNKTIPITNPNTVREAHCNHMWEFRLALV